MADLNDAYKRRYKMRAVGEDGLNIVVSMPRFVIEKEATKRGLSIKEFLEKYRAVALYNSFEGIHYQFEENTEINGALGENDVQGQEPATKPSSKGTTG